MWIHIFYHNWLFFTVAENNAAGDNACLVIVLWLITEYRCVVFDTGQLQQHMFTIGAVVVMPSSRSHSFRFFCAFATFLSAFCVHLLQFSVFHFFAVVGVSDSVLKSPYFFTFSALPVWFLVNYCSKLSSSLSLSLATCLSISVSVRKCAVNNIYP